MLPNWIPSKSYRRLSVSVGQNPVNLHFFLVHVVDVYPQVPAHRICRAVCFGCVVVVVCVLLQGGRGGDKTNEMGLILLPGNQNHPDETLGISKISDIGSFFYVCRLECLYFHGAP